MIGERPATIKIDVDGIEHLILEGAKETLKHPTCQSVFVEVNDNFQQQADSVGSILTQTGFRLVAKEQSGMVENSEAFSRVFNQIWIKSRT